MVDNRIAISSDSDFMISVPQIQCELIAEGTSGFYFYKNQAQIEKSERNS